MVYYLCMRGSAPHFSNGSMPAKERTIGTFAQAQRALGPMMPLLSEKSAIDNDLFGGRGLEPGAGESAAA